MSNDIDIVNSLRDILTARHQTLSVAESVTSGNIQASLSLATQASLFYQGGITVYNGGQKARHLSVEPIHALETDNVSPQVAEQMALGANRLFLSNYSIAITGYATLVPEKNIHDLFAYYAISLGQSILESKRIEISVKESAAAQKEFTSIVLVALNNLLLEPSQK